MRFPSIKRSRSLNVIRLLRVVIIRGENDSKQLDQFQANDTESAVPVPFMRTRLSKQGVTFSTNMLGNLLTKKNKITYTLNKDVNI